MATPAGPAVFRERFERLDGMVTNAWAHWHRDHPEAVRDRVWRVTSGTLYARRGQGWTGRPDPGRPGPRSAAATGSAVFRLRTERSDFGDVHVQLRLRVGRLVRTPRTPAVAWDGAHLWLRYQSPQHLYVASVSRRDGMVVVKKKCPGGTANGGTYHTLGSVRWPLPARTWSTVATSVETTAGGDVRIRVARDGLSLLTAEDRGTGCPPIRQAGAIGLRGDNADLRFDDVEIRQL